MREKAKKAETAEAVSSVLRNETVILENGNTLTVFGCKKILTYEDGEILLQMGMEKLKISGKRLLCTSFCGEALTVRGRIFGIVREPMGEEGKA